MKGAPRPDVRDAFINLLLQSCQSQHCLRRESQYFSKTIKRYATTGAAPKPKQSPPNNVKQSWTIKTSSTSEPVPMRLNLDRNPENRSFVSRIAIPKGERGEKFVPQQLSYPLGLPYPPLAGQNTPKDTRSKAEKRTEFSNQEKALEDRAVLFRSFLRPYFQEWKRMDHYEGKSFESNERLFRRDKALYFPNIWGQTLRPEGDGPDGGTDLAPVIHGKVSVIGIHSGVWAQRQARTFMEDNQRFVKLLDENKGMLQRIDINAQERWFNALLVKLSKSSLRRQVGEQQHGRYFMVRLARDTARGFTEYIRDCMGFLNSQVGYVYLLDTDCKIRWAGSGNAWAGECDRLNGGIERLLAEARDKKFRKGLSRPS